MEYQDAVAILQYADEAEKHKSLRSKIEHALEIQQLHEGPTANIALCRHILTHVATEREWDSLVTVVHHRHGKLSYETHRFYYVKGWFIRFFNDLKDGKFGKFL